MLEPIDQTMDLVIVSPDETVLETKAKKIIVPGAVQELAILPNHTPIYSELIEGVVKVITEDNKTQEVEIMGGILRVRRNKVSIILGFDRETERFLPQ